MIKEYVRYQHRLDDLFRKVSAFTEDTELQAHWAKYLCVLISGYLEVSIREIYSEYAKNNASPAIASYVYKRLEGLRNLNMEDILQLTRSFKKEWANHLEDITKGELKDAVDDIYGNRNRIAHGKDVGITYIRIHDLYQRVVRVIRVIDDQCA